MWCVSTTLSCCFDCDLCSSIFSLSLFLCSTILEEEKVQQEERFRMEVRRQVTVSWDSGNSDEAPPKVRHHWTNTTQTHHTCVTRINHQFINTHIHSVNWDCEFLRLWTGVICDVDVIFTAQQTWLPESSYQWWILPQSTASAQPLPGTDTKYHKTNTSTLLMFAFKDFRVISF